MNDEGNAARGVMLGLIISPAIGALILAVLL